jgi:hypothetical protein
MSNIPNLSATGNVTNRAVSKKRRGYTANGDFVELAWHAARRIHTAGHISDPTTQDTAPTRRRARW